MNEQRGKEKNSTVAISPDVAKKLDIFCRDKDITKKDFISLSLSYFERFGVNPVEHESPTAELEKIRKRLDQVIAFIRTQEKDKINPMFEAISTTEVRIKNDLDTIAKIEHLKSLTDKLNEVFGNVTDKFGDIVNKLSESQKSDKEQTKEILNRLANGLFIIAKGLEEKDNSGLGDKIKNIFSK